MSGCKGSRLRTPPRGRGEDQHKSFDAAVNEWINAVAVMEPASAHRFQRVVEEQVSVQDATYWLEDCLGVVLPTDVDEVMFSLALLHDSSVDEICMVGDRSYIVPVRYSEEVRCWVEVGLFDAVLAPLVLGCLELRDASMLDVLGAALRSNTSNFGGNPPDLLAI